MTNSKMTHAKILKLVQLALLSAISVVLVLFIHFPLFPSAPFLEYDMADVPVLLATFLFGPIEGLIVLAVTSVIQAFALGGNGWVGLVMHFCASGALVIIAGSLYKYKNKNSIKMLIVGLILGSIAMTLLMIPLNLIFTVHFMGSPREAVIQMLGPVIVPFNLIKSLANSAISFVLYASVGKYLKRFVDSAI